MKSRQLPAKLVIKIEDKYLFNQFPHIIMNLSSNNDFVNKLFFTNPKIKLQWYFKDFFF